MRLLVVSQYFWPEDFRVNDLVAELVARGHDVVVLTGAPNYPDGQVFPDYRRNPERFAEYAGASILRVPLLPRGNGSLRLVCNYLSFVISGLLFGPWRLRGRGFDAIFVFQTSPITSAIPALLLRRIKKAPVLMWVLDLWPETLAAVGVVRSSRGLGWVGRLVSFIYRRCDRVLVQSRAFFDNVEKYGGDKQRIRYFPNWAEPLFTQRSHDAALAPEVLPYSGNFNVLFAGNIGEAQDFPAILDAAAMLRDERPTLRWLVVGEGRAAEFVRAEIERRELQRCVVLLGRFPVERMPAFFRCAAVALVTLKREPIFAMTIPGKVQSYLAAGLPILGMLDGEGARVIEESGAGFAAPAGDSASLAGNVRRMMGLASAERRAMSERGQRYCEREFGREALMAALERWIQEVCVTHPSTAAPQSKSRHR